MYQIEVKLALVKSLFRPSSGWKVTVHIDPSEEGKSEPNNQEKIEIAKNCKDEIKELGVNIGAHTKYGKRDLVAIHPIFGTYIVEVEGRSSKQKEQAFYAALSQLIITMKNNRDKINYGIAVPDTVEWKRQLDKISPHIKLTLNLITMVVDKKYNVRKTRS